MKKLVATVVALILVSSLLGCARQDIPRDQTGKALPVMEFVADTDIKGQQMNIVIDAVDQFGGHGTNAETGAPYPWDGIRRSPYSHFIYYEPGLFVSVSFTVIIGGKEGDLVTCTVYDNGKHVPNSAKVAEIKRGSAGASVTCLYTSP